MCRAGTLKWGGTARKLSSRQGDGAFFVATVGGHVKRGGTASDPRPWRDEGFTFWSGSLRETAGRGREEDENADERFAHGVRGAGGGRRARHLRAAGRRDHAA